MWSDAAQLVTMRLQPDMSVREAVEKDSGGSMRIRALVAILGVLALAVVACENEESGGNGDSGPPSEGERPGVTDSEIRLGSLITVNNPLGLPFEDALVGARAYFEKINDDGGIYDREIVIASERDDMLGSNLQEARALVEEDQVFAVLPVVSIFFPGGEYLAEQGTPTFGWNINDEWAAGPNLFGEKGSYVCITCPNGIVSYLMEQTDAQRVAVFAYGGAPQSADCADGIEEGLDKYGGEMVVKDTSLSFGFTDTSAAVASVRDNNADFIATCMDLTGNATLARDIQAAGLKMKGVWAPQGYDSQSLADFGNQLENFYFQAAFWPFEVPNPPDGMQEYLDAMEERNQEPSEFSLAGWVNAHLFVEGLKAAGEDFTQESLVDAINSMDEPFTAGGIMNPTIIWADTDDYPEGAHGPALNGTACNAFVKVENGEFVPQFGEPGSPFVCFEGNNEVDGEGVPSLDDPIYLP
jgi:branched-chain amino acid transport system substrate-binding protein